MSMQAVEKIRKDLDEMLQHLQEQLRSDTPENGQRLLVLGSISRSGDSLTAKLRAEILKLAAAHRNLVEKNCNETLAAWEKEKKVAQVMIGHLERDLMYNQREEIDGMRWIFVVLKLRIDQPEVAADTKAFMDYFAKMTLQKGFLQYVLPLPPRSIVDTDEDGFGTLYLDLTIGADEEKELREVLREIKKIFRRSAAGREVLRDVSKTLKARQRTHPLHISEMRRGLIKALAINTQTVKLGPHGVPVLDKIQSVQISDALLTADAHQHDMLRLVVQNEIFEVAWKGGSFGKYASNPTFQAVSALLSWGMNNPKNPNENAAAYKRQVIKKFKEFRDVNLAWVTKDKQDPKPPPADKAALIDSLVKYGTHGAFLKLKDLEQAAK